MSRFYQGYALTFASEIDLPGATEIDAVPEMVVDVTIAHGQVPVERCHDRRESGTTLHGAMTQPPRPV